MGKTTAEAINKITLKHLTEGNGLLLGQRRFFECVFQILEMVAGGKKEWFYGFSYDFIQASGADNCKIDK